MRVFSGFLIPVAGVLITAFTMCGASVEQIDLNYTPYEPFGVDFDTAGNLYVCEYKGQKITKIDSSGRATTYAGTGDAGYGGDGGDAVKAQFKDPHGLVIRNQKMYVADTLNHRVRVIDMKTGKISTLAGTGAPGFSGDGGPAVKAQFNGVYGIALSSKGERMYVADLANRRIRAIDLKSGIVTTIAGNGENSVPVDGQRAAQSPLVDPRAVAADSRGQVYILERRGNALRAVDTEGNIKTVVAPGSMFPELNQPKYVSVDSNDNVLIADSENHIIRRYNPKTGKTTTIAGTTRRGNMLVPPDPLKTELARPHGVITNRAGEIYITDSLNNRILRLRP